VLKRWNDLQTQAEKINRLLPAEYKDSYFELVLHPLKAFSNLYEMYLALRYNKIYSSQKNIRANFFADKVKQLYETDSLLSVTYNTKISDGKWNHMMDQTHIGYTNWQQPPVNKTPEVIYISNPSSDEDILKGTPRTALNLVPKDKKINLFYEQSHYVSIQASHYTKAANSNNIKWKTIPDIGRDGDGITTFPVTAAEQIVSKNPPNLKYEVYTYDSGEVKLNAYLSPTLNFHNDPEGLRYAISIDDEQPQIISVNKDDNDTKTWSQWVANNIIITTSTHTIAKAGKHTVKYWMVSPAVILQKIVVDFGGVKPSYLGPPETIFKQDKN
jgi:hypothetical protein